MRIQASLEFLVILGAISLLSLTTVTLYKGSVGKSDQLIGGIIPGNSFESGNLLGPSALNPQLLIYLPENSTLNKPNRMEVAAFGCYNGTVSLSARAQSLYFPQNAIIFGVNGISTISLYFTPLSEGFGVVGINYTYACSGSLQNRSSVLTTYVSGSNLPAQNQLPTVSLENRNESVVYALVDNGKIASLNEFSHCTYASMFGPTGIAQQCGTEDAWSYSVFSSYCYSTSNYYTATTCIVPTNTTYGLSSISPSDYRLKYSLRLGINYNSVSLYSNLSDNSTSEVLLANEIVGSAEVESAVSPDPLLTSSFLSIGGKTKVVNQAAYEQYIQAKNNLYSTLSFYNQSYVSTDIQSSIEAAVSAYDKASNNLINSSSLQNSACFPSDSNYLCKASSPFSYQINAILSGINFGNETIPYLGSEISIISK
ncbi:MAG: hypothetical protein KGH65_01720 [Candidatus Micrarchaeota archaeon]|nr:hypothetical protein [Candidatus Micrarchaeota archaeon]